MGRSATRGNDRRWAHVDGRLTLCAQHVKPVLRNLIAANWYEMVDSDIARWREVMGYAVPCEFCIADIECERLDVTPDEALSTTTGEHLDN